MNAEKVRASLSGWLGVPLRIISEREWSSLSFHGLRVWLEGDDTLPALPDRDQPEIEGMILIDVVPTSERQLSVVVLEGLQ